jgi:L-arabinose transport system ATP-binding protein
VTVNLPTTALEVHELMGPGLSEPATFSVRKGELVGFFGLVGAGRSELMKLIYGAFAGVVASTLITATHSVTIGLRAACWREARWASSTAC